MVIIANTKVTTNAANVSNKPDSQSQVHKEEYLRVTKMEEEIKP